MAQLPFRQDITIYTPENDLVPLIGTADAAGVPIVPSFSTDGTHPRPWLKPILAIGASAINFRDGTGTTGQMTVEVLDKRTIATDQASGLMTQLAADATGDTALVSVRCLVRGLALDGATMETLFDGIVYNVSLNETTWSGWKLVLKDIRDRERKVRLFPKATTTVIWPILGPASGYGQRTQWDATAGRAVPVGAPVMPPISGEKGTYTLLETRADGSKVGVFRPSYMDPAGTFGQVVRAVVSGPGAKPIKEDVLAAFGSPMQANQNDFDGTASGRVFSFPHVITEWSTTPDGPWNTIVAPPAFPMAAPTVQKWIQAVVGGDTMNLFRFTDRVAYGGVTQRVVGSLRFDIPVAAAGQPAQVFPADGATIYVRVRSNKAPTPEVPLWFEGNAADILTNYYTGVYSPAGLDPRVRFDAAAMTAFKLRAPWLTVKVTESVVEENGSKSWAAENIYRVTGYAPAIRSGVVYPVSGDLPDAATPLVTLDDSVIYAGRAGWNHGSENAVNHVEFRYERDLIPRDFGREGVMLTQQVTIERDRIASQNRHGAKPVIFQPVSVRAVVPLAWNGAINPDTTHELGTQIGLQRAEALIRRFANGGPEAWAECRTSMVATVRQGDWVVMAASWLPDYASRRRGMNRLMQVVKVEPTAPHIRRLTLSDAGPLDQPVAAPTLGAVTLNADSTVQATFTAIPVLAAKYRYRIEVQQAYGEAVPDTNSGTWRTAGPPLAAAGTFVGPANPAGLLVWTRYRGVGDGIRASAWSVPVSTRVPAVGALRDVRVTVLPWDSPFSPGQPVVEWTATAGTAGLRINYARYFGAAVPAAWTGTLDVDATTGSSILPFVLKQSETIIVQAIPYSGFGAGAVNGTAGTAASAGPATRADLPYIGPTIAEEQSRTTTVGTLTLTPTDPQARITRYMIATRAGNLGAWSAFTQDVATPYGGSVTLLQGEASAVAYQVFAIDQDGIERLYQSAVVDFPTAPLVGTMMVRITPGTFTTTSEPYTVESLAPDGTRGTVTLVQVVGLTVASGPSVGVATQDPGTGVAWTFTRATPGSPDGYAVWRSAKAGFQSDDDSTIVPSQDKDTLALQVQLRPVASTDPTQAWADLLVTDPSGSSAAVTVTLTFSGMATIGIPGNAAAGSGATIAATPGTLYRLTMPLPPFGSAPARLAAVGARSGILGDSDMVDVAPVGRDTIMPSLKETITETPTLGTLVLTPYDPQIRLGSVEFRTYSGGTLVQDWTVVAPVAGTYTQTVPLVEGQTSRIGYRWKAVPFGGGAAVDQDGREVRYRQGGRPLSPDIQVEVSTQGIAKILLSGDANTSENRAILTLDAPASEATLDAQPAILGRYGQYVHPVNLLPGQKFFVTAASYNAGLGGALRAKAGDTMVQPGQWIGLSSSGATVSVSTVALGSRTITIAVAPANQTALFDVFVREYRVDPGAAVSVQRTGYRLASNLVGNQNIDIPVANPLNFILVTVVAYDALNRVGPDTEFVTGKSAHVVALKLQAAAGSNVPPAPPTNLTAVASGTAANLSITAPGANLPDTWRIKRDGATVADIAVTVAVNGVQAYSVVGPHDPGNYSYQVWGVKAGVVSDSPSPAAVVTFAQTTIPTPTIAVGAYQPSTQSFPITITPAAGTPAGVTWQLQHDGISATFADVRHGYTNAEVSTALSFNHTHSQLANEDWREYFKVSGTKAGYLPSAVSAEVTAVIPMQSATYR
jgi:hypothetical protein